MFESTDCLVQALETYDPGVRDSMCNDFEL